MSQLRTPAAALAVKVAAGVLALLSAGVHAATETRNIAVSATVQSNCNITSPTTGNNILLSFGTVDVAATGEPNTSTTFTVTCNKGASVTVALDNGANPTGTQKRMYNGADYLNYSIFRPTGTAYNTCPASIAGGTEWNAANTLNPSSLWTSTGGPNAITICGRLATPQLQASPGSYTDTVVLTISY